MPHTYHRIALLSATALLAACGGNTPPAAPVAKTAQATRQGGAAPDLIDHYVAWAAHIHGIVAEPDGVTIFDAITGTGRVEFLAKPRRIHYGFDNVSALYDADGAGGQVTRLYQAAFNRIPDRVGLGFWLDKLETGAVSLHELATIFTQSQEFKDLYGANAGNAALVLALYRNVLHREPDQQGYRFWLSALDEQRLTLPGLLVYMSESDENRSLTRDTIQRGVWYQRIPMPAAGPYKVGGTIQGLGNHTGLTLAEGLDGLRIYAASTAFELPNRYAEGHQYRVRIITQPPFRHCVVGNGAGTVGQADATGVRIDCNEPAADVLHTVGGTISGLDQAAGLVLASNGARIAVAARATTFTTGAPQVAGSRYNVTIAEQPSGRNCTIQSGSGYLAAAVANIEVTCLPTEALHLQVVAGDDVTAGYADGPALQARFRSPAGLALDSAGNLLVAESGNHTVRKLAPDGIVSTVAGSPGPDGYGYGYVDGPAAAAKFWWLSDVAPDSNGNLYVSDTFNHRIRKITPAGQVTTVAGSGQNVSADGSGAAASFAWPGALAVDAAGNLYVRDRSALRKVTPSGVVSTIAGGAVNQNVPGEGGLAIDRNGNLYLLAAPAQFGGAYLLQKITPAGAITTIAELPSREGEQMPEDAGGVAIHPDTGVVYAAIGGRIHLVYPTGTVATVARPSRRTYLLRDLQFDRQGRLFGSSYNAVVRITNPP